jgi:hypothetical protein
MNWYTLVSAAVLLFLSVTWSQAGWLNILCKIVFMGLAVWGFVLRFGGKW